MKHDFFPKFSLVSTVALALTLQACGKKEDEETTTSPTSPATSETPGVTAATGNELAMTGQLALSELGLTATEQGVLVFQFSRGEVLGTPEAVAVDADGKFSAKIPKADEAVEFLVAQTKLSRDQRDWDGILTNVKKITKVPADFSVDMLKSMSEEEIQEGVGELAAEMKDAGRMTLLVAYDKSGDTKAEAQTFRFIGLQTGGGKNLSGIPNGNLKGNVNLGEITGSGADVTSEVKAADALDISSAALETFADMGRALKSVKNEYMNTKWSVQPFYFWRGNSNGPSNVIDAWSNVSVSEYNGYGFYVPSNGDQGLTQADVCGGKAIEFVPPGNSITLQYTMGGNTLEKTITKFSNTGTSVGSGNTCNGGSDYYARRDERDGSVSYMLNFGTGGSIQNSPEGLWSMTVDGTEVGRFDLATSMPVDANKKPLVFLPQVRFNTSGGQIVSVDVELYRWTGSAYEKVTDMDPVRRLFKDFRASINNDESSTKITVQADGTLKGLFDSSEQDEGEARNPPIAASSVNSAGFAIYYEVGNASYRMEFR